jgi:hypothetical protein
MKEKSVHGNSIPKHRVGLDSKQSKNAIKLK